MSSFPRKRMRRLRRTNALRAMRRETRLAVSEFVQPIFVVEDPAQAGPVSSMPGMARFSLETLSEEIDVLAQRGVRSVLIFGVPAGKDDRAQHACRGDGIVPRAVGWIKGAYPELNVITDVCVCSYTDHGHCGMLDDDRVDNDATLKCLAEMARVHAEAGADLVAPSAMMDGQVQALRQRLDDAGFDHVGILSYAVKYASSLYQPFREAGESAPSFGDRRGYQMDPANVQEALAEAALDVEEGADMIMVKPALPYLDVVSRIKSAMPDVPLAAYQVSGEYGMVKAAAAAGMIDEQQVALEMLTAMRRAGADVIITYWAREMTAWIGG